MTGDNGAGKSTFLNALCWCLYADTPFFAIGDSPEIGNKNAPEGSMIEVEVEAQIDGQSYVYHRTATPTSRGGVLSVSYEEDGNWNVLDTASSADAVRKLLPKDIRHLFIFNGEQISGIFKPDNSNGLKASIYKVAEINILDNAVRHLKFVEEDYLKEIENSNRNKRQIETQRERKMHLWSSIDRDENAIKVLENQILSHKDKLAELNKLIEATASAREMIEKRDILVEKLEELDEYIQDLKADRMDKFQSCFHKALLMNDFQEYSLALEEAKDNNLIPPPIVPAVTQRILESKICICGRGIHEDEVAFIEHQHKINSEKEELRYLTDGIFVNQRVKSELEDAKYKLQDIYQNIQEKSLKKSEIQEKITEINNSLDDVNMAHENPNARRNDIQREIDSAVAAKGRLSNAVDIAKREMRECEEQINKIIKKDASTAMLDKRRLLSKRIARYITDMKSELEESIREKLRESLSKTFFTILPNTNFTDIQIDEDYTVSLLENDLIYATVDISTGQAKALGLSLAYSLSKSLDYASFPMLIDNLYGDLKDDLYKDLTQTIEALSSTKQVILMDLNGEKTRSMLNDNKIAQVFNIVRSDDDSSTDIQEVK
jgi:DNA sulfur modification protein DndD